MRWILILCFITFLPTQPIKALDIDESFSSSSISHESYYLIEDNLKLEPDEVLALYLNHSEKFTRVENGNFGINPKTHWFVSEIRSELIENTSLIIENDYPLVDEVNLFVFNENSSLISSFHSGDGIALSKHTIQSRFPSAILHLSAGSKVYIVTQQTSLGTNVYQPKVKTLRSYIEDNQTQLYFLGAYLGLVVMMLVYHGFMYLYFREPINLSYSVFLFGNGLFQISLNGMGFMLLWPEHPALSNFAHVIAGGIGTYAAADFTYRYLNIEEASFSKKLLARISKLLAIGIVLYNLTLPYDIALKLTSLSAGVCFIIFILLGFMQLKQNPRAATYFLTAWGVFVIGMLIIVLRNFGILPNNNFTVFSVQIGSAIEIILLSVGIVDRIQHEKREKYLAIVAASKAEESSKLETQTRFHIASELAHRLNNPLNYMATAQTNLETTTTKLRDEIQALFDGEQSQEATQVLNGLMEYFDELSIMGKQLDAGMNKAAASVKEIRLLSGVDGIELQATSVRNLLEKLLEKLKSDINQETGFPFERLHPQLQENDSSVITNLIFFVSVSERAIIQACTWFKSLESINIKYDNKVILIDICGLSKENLEDKQAQLQVFNHMLEKALVRLETRASEHLLGISLVFLKA